MNRIAELKQAAAKILADMRGLLDKATAEKRELSADEVAQYTKMEAECDAKRAQADREEKLAAVESEVSRSVIPAVRPEVGEPENRKAQEKRAAFERYLRGTINDAELRALQADSGTAGGYLQMPQELAAGIIQAMDDDVFVRRLATVMPMTQAASLGQASLDNDPDDASWTGEITSVSEDSTMSFGKRELKPWPCSKLIKVSNKLLRVAPRVEALVQDRLAYKFGITAEKAYMTGTGASQPLGVFTASDDGIGTARDVSTGNAATSPTFDGLIEAKYTLKGQYWRRAAWIFHRSCLKLIRKLKDGDGQYIWEPSVVAGQPDRLLELPFYMSEYAPSTFTASQYVGIVGDFSFYHIVDSLDMSVQKLVELYARTSQTGFIGRLESDGMPVLAEAFVRVKLAAS